MKTAWIYDRRFLLHETGRSHPECGGRLEVIEKALLDADLLQRMVELPFFQASAEQLTLVHEPAYVALVEMMCDEGFTFVGSEDTQICSRSYDAATLATGGVLAACDAVLDGRVSRAFCAVRPPGHHAEMDQAMGFCLFNHVAIATEYALRNCGLARVAIVDFDVHHGNGTQHIFESRNDVFYVSLHERPATLPFPGTGEADETGTGVGQGFTRNVPLSAGSGLDAYLQALDDVVLPDLNAFRPELLLVSAGFDGLMWDRLANISLQASDYYELTRRLVAIANQHAKGRLVSVLEGGYDLSNLGAAVVAHVEAILKR